MRQNFQLGFDYYPEHWPEKQWAEDLQLMRDCGTTCVRIAEFAWSRMEPREGQFEFDWLDRFFSLAEQYEIDLILGTPTAAPPPWAWQTYPGIVLVGEDGQPLATTWRRYTCPTSAEYLRLSDAIVEQMARRYGAHNRLLGWQTDNEFNGQPCYCPSCQEHCREWLRERHGTVEALNENLGLVFWAHEVTDWEQVILPRRGLDRAHPSVRLEVQRFFSDAWCAFARRQTELIRQHSPDRWVTHNLPGYQIQIDLFDLAAAHDFLSMDLYPKAMLETHQRVALANDLTRSVQERTHWVMELQTGTPCTKFYKAPIPREGQLRLWAHQCAAHGAEGVVFFRWRKSPVGQEMFGNGLLDQDSRPRRCYVEVQQLGEDFQQLAERLPAYDAPPEVALVLDFADKVNAQIHSFALDVDFYSHLRQWYRAARRLGLNVRFVRSTDDLTPYALVVAPNQFTTTPDLVANFTGYVEQGGTLIGGLRMGWFDSQGKPAKLTLPGGLTDLFGVEVEEYERVLEPNPNRAVFVEGEDAPLTCRQWNYVLNDLGARPLARFERDYYAGRTALSCQEVGGGKAVFVGTMLDDADLLRLLKKVTALAELETPGMDWPETVELVRLQDGARSDVWVVLNHAHEAQTVTLPQSMTDLLSCRQVHALSLPPLTARWLRSV